MKILYLSCHEVLEYSEVRMFHDLGHDVFSLNGAYQNPGDDPARKRPGIPGMRSDPRMLELALQCSRENIHPEIIEWADVILSMHMPQWILGNWPRMRHKRIIFRSIGQSTPDVEHALISARMDGLQIVRYSPRESEIPMYIGADATIRFNQRPEEYHGWTGVDNSAITFAQCARDRGTQCGYQLMDFIHSQIPDFTLYGNGNENVSFSGGLVTFARQLELLRRAGAYFSAGSHPASYTLNFMEAWMTGAPMVVAGPTWGHPQRSGYPQATYEVHELVEHGVSGLVADTPQDMADAIQELRSDSALQRTLSDNGREAAIKYFGEDTISAQWMEFLGS